MSDDLDEASAALHAHHRAMRMVYSAVAATIACGACAAWAYLTDARNLTRSLVALGLIAAASSATALVFALRARRLRQALE